jgi:hypothetical protein
MNSIIEAQEDFFYDRTISEEKGESLLISLSLKTSYGLLSGYHAPKPLHPVDQMYEYKLPDTIINFQDEVYRLATTLSESEAKKAISELYQDDYPVYIKNYNPYSSTVHYSRSCYPQEENFIKWMTSAGNWETPSSTIRWTEQSFIKNRENE